MTASAVQVLTDSGETLVINATREIILAAGTYRNPALLEYFGVGNPKSVPHFLYFDLVGLASDAAQFPMDYKQIPVRSMEGHNGVHELLGFIQRRILNPPNRGAGKESPHGEPQRPSQSDFKGA